MINEGVIDMTKICQKCLAEHSLTGDYCETCCIGLGYTVRVPQKNKPQNIAAQKIDYCRNCGVSLDSSLKMIAGNTVCTACGFEPLRGDKYCQGCGKTTQTGQVLCVACSSTLVSNNPYNNKTTQVNDGADSGVAIISFLIPLIGFILYATMVSNQPKKANSALTGALVGLLVGVVFYVAVLAM